ncbi:hypothetical protein BKA81DRAFT_353318 [Phyllosticta paracitricarpa]
MTLKTRRRWRTRALSPPTAHLSRLEVTVHSHAKTPTLKISKMRNISRTILTIMPWQKGCRDFSSRRIGNRRKSGKSMKTRSRGRRCLVVASSQAWRESSLATNTSLLKKLRTFARRASKRTRTRMASCHLITSRHWQRRSPSPPKPTSSTSSVISRLSWTRARPRNRRSSKRKRIASMNSRPCTRAKPLSMKKMSGITSVSLTALSKQARQRSRRSKRHSQTSRPCPTRSPLPQTTKSSKRPKTSRSSSTRARRSSRGRGRLKQIATKSSKACSSARLLSKKETSCITHALSTNSSSKATQRNGRSDKRKKTAPTYSKPSSKRSPA